MLLGCGLHSYYDFLPYVHFEVFATVSSSVLLTPEINYRLPAISCRRCRCYWRLIIAGVVTGKWQLIFDGVVVTGVMESMKIPDKA
jgi:hypothetical protein